MNVDEINNFEAFPLVFVGGGEGWGYWGDFEKFLKLKSMTIGVKIIRLTIYLLLKRGGGGYHTGWYSDNSIIQILQSF